MSDISKVLADLQSARNKKEKELRGLEHAIQALRGLSHDGARPTLAGSPRKRRTMSASARRRIVAAQKARWAKWRAERRKKAA
jgi:hypothetical protein